MRTTKPMVVLIATILAVSAARLGAQEVVLTGGANESQLVGVWHMEVVPPAVAGVPAFQQLITFSSDATLAQTQHDAGGPPFPFTPGQGVWRRTGAGPGSRTFGFTMVVLLYDPTTFASLGNAKIVGRVRLNADGNSLTGEERITVSDNDGNVLFEGGGAPLTGTRVRYERY